MKDIRTTRGGTTIKDFAAALMKPLQYNGNLMEAFNNWEVKRARFNSQKMVLQAALNEIFGISVAPFIIVELNPSLARFFYVYNLAESNTTYFYNLAEEKKTYIYNLSELGAVYDFKIKIPVFFYSAENERRIKAQVDIYKMYGATYITETY